MNRSRRIFLYSRNYACRTGWLLQPAIGPGVQEGRDRPTQNPGKGPGPGGIGRAGCRSERGWIFGVHLGRRHSLPPVLRTPVEIVHGGEYFAEGVFAQKGH